MLTLQPIRIPPPEPDAYTAHVNTLTSFDTELPYQYYKLPFCKPAEGVKRIANTANPGTILEGIRIENSPYNFTMKVGRSGFLRGMRAILAVQDDVNHVWVVSIVSNVRCPLDRVPAFGFEQCAPALAVSQGQALPARAYLWLLRYQD